MNKIVNLCLPIFFLLLASFAGCASHNQIIQQKLSNEAATFVGKSTDELLLKMGPPDSKEKLSTGDEVWTYRSSKIGERKGMTVTIGDPNLTSPKIITWIEIINFVVGPQGIVESYSVYVR